MKARTDMRLLRPNRSRLSFTLYELAIVVSIIATLASIPRPGHFADPRRATSVRDLTEMTIIRRVLVEYKQERGVFPDRLDKVKNERSILDFHKTHTFIPLNLSLSDRLLFIFHSRSPQLIWLAVIIVLVFGSIDIGLRFKRKERERGWVVLLYAVLVMAELIVVPYYLSFKAGPGYYVERNFDSGLRPNLEYGYHTDGKNGFILQAVGVNEVKDLDDLGRVPMESRDTARKFLAPYEYDPTNGTTSPGDLFRVEIDRTDTTATTNSLAR